MKVFISGVAGFVGSNFLEACLKKKYTVVGIDNFSWGNPKNIEPFLKNKHFRFIEGDVCDEKFVMEHTSGADAIVHLAAHKIPRYGNALKTLEINVSGTKNMIQAALKNSARLVFSSTSDVYGMNPELPFNEESVMVMGPPSVKRWSYAISKMYDEQLMFAYGDEHGLKFSIVRYFGSYGPNMSLSWWGGPPPIFIKAALTNETITVHGDGLQTRSFTYVDDTVRGTMAAMEHPDSESEVFNIGNNEEISILDFAYLVWKKCGNKSKPKIDFVDYQSFSGRYQDVRRRIPDINKSKLILNFVPKVSLEDGLERTIKWEKKVLGL